MARAKGTVKYGLNLEVQTPAPLDARSLVATKADLTLSETWVVAPSTQAYTYTGMLVVVASDPTTSNNGIYMLKSRTGWADPEQWTKLSNETVFSITGLNITGLYNETPDHVYMKADVVSVNGSLYYCLVDNTTNIKPTVTTDWQLNWTLFQLKGSQGNDGATPTIGNNGNWFINGVDQLKKAIGENGITPNIQDGFWYIGNEKQGKATGTSITISTDGYWVLDGIKSTTLALGLQGQSAIANINYLGAYKPNTQYYKSDRNGKTDVVIGSDGTMYAALVDSKNIDPVSDTLHNTWAVFSMRGTEGKQGDTPYIKDGYWWIGTERKDVKAAGDVLSISSDGYWEINGVKTDKKAVPENGQNGTNGTNGTNGENAVSNINVRGPWQTGQTYLHLNEDGTTDVVLGSDGTSYFCLQDTSIDPTTDTTHTYWAQFSMAGSPGLTPHIELDPDGEYRWYIGTQNQNIIAQGKNGQNGIDGRNASQPYITEQGYWGYKLLMPDGTYQYNTTTVVAEGLTPYIKEGFWWIGNRNTGVQAIGQSAIANLNYLGTWKPGTTYYNKNTTANNWTDVVLGADDNSYYCKANNTDKNPCKLVDNVWVRDEAQSAYWAKFVMKGTATDGRNIELRRNEGWIQWRVVGEGNDQWKNLLETKTLVSKELSDISTPIGSVIMFSGKAANIPTGYLLANGDTIQKTDYPELVQVLSGSNTATSANLPDLRQRFVVGYDSRAFEYNVIGKTGGASSVKLTAEQSGLRSHNHDIPAGIANQTGDYRLARAIGQYTMEFKGMRSVGGLDAQQSHENRPPYYVLAYIIKASYQGEIRTPYDTYLQTVPEGSTPMQKSAWLETMKGETGIAGLNPRGDYDNTATYMELDNVVIVNPLNPELGNSFSCISKAETGISGIEPGLTEGWNTSWQRLVLRGAPGKNAPEVLVRYSASNSTAEGSDWHATPTTGDKYIRFSTNGTEAGLGTPMLVKGDSGNNAKPIKIQYCDTIDGTFTDTPTITSKYLKFGTYNEEGTLTWSSTISISGGSSVFTSNIQVNLPSGRYFGKYAHNALIESNGKTFEQVLKDIAIQSIPPTISGTTISGTLPYNHPLSTDSDYSTYVASNPINLTVNFGTFTINNTGATAKSIKLYYNRDGGSSWTEIVDAALTKNSTSYAHKVNELLGANNTASIYYKLVFTDSTDASAQIIVNKAVEAYVGATYTKGTPIYSTSREMGSISTRIVGAIGFNTGQRIGVSQNASIISRTLYYRINADTEWTAISAGILTNDIDYTHNNSALKDAYKIEYQLVVVSTKPSGATHTATFSTTDLGGTINLNYNWYYGVGTGAPTGVDAAAKRAAVKDNNPAISATGTFNIYTGTSAKIWICLPPGRTLTLTAYDVSANANFVFSAGVDYIMNDAGGNARTFKMYEATSGFSNTHQIRITIS